MRVPKDHCRDSLNLKKPNILAPSGIDIELFQAMKLLNCAEQRTLFFLSFFVSWEIEPLRPTCQNGLAERTRPLCLQVGLTFPVRPS
jgi:hypothetical protein